MKRSGDWTLRFRTNQQTKERELQVNIGAKIDVKTGTLVGLSGFTALMVQHKAPLAFDVRGDKSVFAKFQYQDVVAAYADQLDINPGQVRVYRDGKLFDYTRTAESIGKWRGHIRLEVCQTPPKLTPQQLLMTAHIMDAIRHSISTMIRVCDYCYRVGAPLLCKVCKLRRWCNDTCKKADHTRHFNIASKDVCGGDMNALYPCLPRADDLHAESSRQVLLYHTALTRKEWSMPKNPQTKEEFWDIITLCDYLATLYDGYSAIVSTSDGWLYITRFENRRFPMLPLAYRNESVPILLRAVTRCTSVGELVATRNVSYALSFLHGSGWLGDVIKRSFSACPDVESKLSASGSLLNRIVSEVDVNTADAKLPKERQQQQSLVCTVTTVPPLPESAYAARPPPLATPRYSDTETEDADDEPKNSNNRSFLDIVD